jgi:hypothetical protein
MVNSSNSPNRYEPLVEMAREMSHGTGASAQAHFDYLLALLRGPSLLRRGLWFVGRNRRLAVVATAFGAFLGAHLVI